MQILRLILAGGYGGCFGYAISAFFRGRINVGLGVLTIGLLLAIWYIVILIATRD